MCIILLIFADMRVVPPADCGPRTTGAAWLASTSCASLEQCGMWCNSAIALGTQAERALLLRNPTTTSAGVRDRQFRHPGYTC